MRTKKSGQWHVWVSVGLLMMSSSLFLMRQLPASLPHADFIKGITMGAAIGLMLVGLMLARKHQSNPNA